MRESLTLYDDCWPNWRELAAATVIVPPHEREQGPAAYLTRWR